MTFPFRVRTERCESCVYRLPYPKATRDRLMGEVEANDGFVQCHCHAAAAHVCCRGYFDAVGEHGGTALQLAIRFDRAGIAPIEWVAPDQYPVADAAADQEDQ